MHSVMLQGCPVCTVLAVRSQKLATNAVL